MYYNFRKIKLQVWWTCLPAMTSAPIFKGKLGNDAQVFIHFKFSNFTLVTSYHFQTLLTIIWLRQSNLSPREHGRCLFVQQKLTSASRSSSVNYSSHSAKINKFLQPLNFLQNDQQSFFKFHWFGRLLHGTLFRRANPPTNNTDEVLILHGAGQSIREGKHYNLIRGVLGTPTSNNQFQSKQTDYMVRLCETKSSRWNHLKLPPNPFNVLVTIAVLQLKKASIRWKGEPQWTVL